MTNNTEDQIPVWDLSALYSGIDDPKILSDAKQACSLATTFDEKYREKITEVTPASEILSGIQQLEVIFELLERPVIFAMLLNSVDSKNASIGAFYQKSQIEFTTIYNSLIFFDLSLVKLSDARQKELMNSPELNEYKHFLEKQFELKSHRLTEAEERIMNDKSITSRGGFVRLFDQHMATKQYSLNGAKVTQKEILDSLHSSDQGVRKTGAESFTAGLREDAPLLTYIFNICATDKEIHDRYHKFETPQQGRNMDNEVTQATVDSMVNAVTSNYGVVADYYKFKKNVIGLDKLYDYDRYAPLEETKEKFTYEQAKEIILTSFRKFSPNFAANAQKFFDRNWIHAQILPGKQGGAYCHPCTPGTHPVIFMNFQGEADDVKTLAHELGHGVNDLFMSKQRPFNYGAPLTLAETASVFAEMIVFQDLKEKITDPKQKLGFIMSKVEGIIATIFRQVSMHRFENEFYKQKTVKGELSTEEINKIWYDSQKEMFGDSVELTENYATWWSYVQHFLHVPFYVYAYAFGELLVLSLYSRYQQEGESFVPKYLELMSAGSTQSPQDLLAKFNIDLTDPNFWTEGLRPVSELIAEAKELYAQIK